MDVAIAIDAEAIDVVWRKQTTDYDPDTGRAIVTQGDFPVIRATIQPATGKQLMDLPEGVRVEAKFMFWSRTDVCLSDQIAVRRSTLVVDVYRVVYAWPRRPNDGFMRAALGYVGEERALP